jgi:hypothetical protein
MKETGLSVTDMVGLETQLLVASIVTVLVCRLLPRKTGNDASNFYKFVKAY